MMEDAYLDIYMEDRLMGGGLDPYDDAAFDDVDEDYFDDVEDFEPEPREDFGWFGDEALCGE